MQSHRIHCYKCTASELTRERLWRLIQFKDGFISDRYSHMLFWFPAQCETFALLIDPTLERIPREDYIL